MCRELVGSQQSPSRLGVCLETARTSGTNQPLTQWVSARKASAVLVCGEEIAPVSLEAVTTTLCPALLVGSGTRGCLCCCCLPWGQAQTCLQLEVSLGSGETSPEHAFASSDVWQSLPGSDNLLPLCEQEGSVPVSWHE